MFEGQGTERPAVCCECAFGLRAVSGAHRLLRPGREGPRRVETGPRDCLLTLKRGARAAGQGPATRIAPQTSTTSTCTCGFLPQTALTARARRARSRSTGNRVAALAARQALEGLEDRRIDDRVEARAVARALRQAGDHHVRIARHFAFRRQRDRDRHDAGERQAAPLGDAILAGRQQDLAVLEPPAVVDLADRLERRRARSGRGRR